MKKCDAALEAGFRRLDASEGDRNEKEVGDQVLLAWAIQRAMALLTSSKIPSQIKENVQVTTIPEDAMREISEGVKSRDRFNAVVETGVRGFIPRRKRFRFSGLQLRLLASSNPATQDTATMKTIFAPTHSLR